MRNLTRLSLLAAIIALNAPVNADAQRRYTDADGKVRIALSKQPFSPNGVSRGPTTMAEGEQFIIDNSRIEQLTVDDLRNATPAVFAQMDRLNDISDRIDVHGGLSLAAVNRMITDAVAGVITRENQGKSLV
jgi:hypothetical protein